MPDRVGQQIGNYRLLRFLGKGGFAEVYLGQHVHIDSRQAAIKILYLQDVDARRFREEANTTAKLEHPHIVRLLDFAIEQDGTPFLVLDYAPGGSLRARHPKGSMVPLDRVKANLKQIAPALQYAHDQHIIHRDIKPENMLIGRKGELLLSDFGIAVLTQTGRTTIATGYSISGTPFYMAPETYKGKPVKESDQYSLAIVIYEWLCGIVPFSGGDFIQLGFIHASEPVPSLREKNPAIPSDVEAVIFQALSKDPKDRFKSIQAFATAFEQACTFPAYPHPVLPPGESQLPTLPAVQQGSGVEQVEQPVPGQSIPTELSPAPSSGQTVEASEPPRQSVAGEIPHAVPDEHVEPVPSQSTPVEVPLNMAGRLPLQTPVAQQPIAPTLPATPVPPSSTGAVPVLAQPSVPPVRSAESIPNQPPPVISQQSQPSDAVSYHTTQVAPSTRANVPPGVQSYRRMFLVRGTIAIVFGVLALVLSPGITLLGLVYLFGGYVLISGITAAALALRHTKEQGWAPLLVEGILGILAGIVAFVWPGLTAFVFLFLIAAWAIVTGIMQIVGAFVLPLGAGREWLLGLAGLASIIFGVLIVYRPVAGLVALVWLIGIYALVFGILYIVAFFQTRSLASSQT